MEEKSTRQALSWVPPPVGALGRAHSSRRQPQALTHPRFSVMLWRQAVCLSGKGETKRDMGDWTTFSFLPEALCDLAQKGYKGCYMGRGSEPLNCKEKCECHLVCLDINKFRIQDNWLLEEIHLFYSSISQTSLQGFMFIPFLSYVLNSAWVHAKSGFPGGATGKEHTHQCRRHKRGRFNPWVRKIPWRRAQQPTPVGHNWKQFSLKARMYRSWFVAYKTKFFIVVSDRATLWTEPARRLCPWDSPGKNTGVDCHFLLQGIFPTQGLNPHLLCLLRW